METISGIRSAWQVGVAVTSEPAGRRVRADAQKNRQRLLEVAVRALSEQGADVAPATIAKLAGVGVGTLYRHFPTREALIEAAYRSDLTGLCDTVPGLLAEHTAAQALRIWMGHCVDHAMTKHGMADALRVVLASGVNLYAESRSLLTDAIAALLQAGASDGTLRADLDPFDVLIMLSGIPLAVGEWGTSQQISRLLDLLMDGLTKGVSAAP
jgi:AcrR family transcriptional regulator